MEIKCEWNTCLGSIRVCEALNIWHTAANEGLLKPERSSENLTAPQNPSKPSFRISDGDNRTSWTNKHPAIHLHTRGNHSFTQKWNAFLSTCFFPAREIKFPDVQINTLIITRVKTVTLSWQVWGLICWVALFDIKMFRKPSSLPQTSLNKLETGIYRKSIFHECNISAITIYTQLSLCS